MQKLTNKEEEIMQILWKLERAFVKEILAEIKEDQPHYNTLSTIVRILEEKGFVAHNAFGNSHQYYPIVALEDYRKRFMTTAIDNYFDSSYKNLVSFFAQEEKISAEELREILEMIEKSNDMENLIFYLGKASVLLAIFFLAYYFLLRKETFFNSNRWFLLAGIFTSLLLPFLVFNKVISVEPIKSDFQIDSIATLPNFIPSNAPEFEINWFYVIGVIYFIGVLFFFGKFIKDMFSLYKILKHKESIKLEGFKLMDTNKIQSPFSFFSHIVYNSAVFNKEELENIIAHEKVHSSQLHSADMLLGQILCIFFWFNLFAWLYKKSIAQNLEFIADSVAFHKVSDKIKYQKTLLKVSAPHLCIPITNHFYQSLIKKRIVMLNKKQSKRKSSWKYATVFPLIIIFMLQFQIETVAQVKKSSIVSAEISESNVSKVYSIVILSSTSDKDLTGYFTRFKNDYNVVLAFKSKRNTDNEIVWLKMNYKNKSGKLQERIFGNSKSPISSLLVEWNENRGNLNISEIASADEAMAVSAIAISHPNSQSKQEEVVLTEKQKTSETSGFSMGFKTSSSEDIFRDSMNNPSIDAANALIIIDGKQATDKEFEALNHEEIRSVSVMGKTSPMLPKWIEKYGEKAKSGVITIGTKDAEITLGIDVSKDVKLINDNSGFIIDKNSKESDLEYYKSELLKSNIIFKYKAKRNNSNQIHSLDVEIFDNTASKNQFVTKQFRFNNDEKVIPNVFIGRKNNSLVITTIK